MTRTLYSFYRDDRSVDGDMTVYTDYMVTTYPHTNPLHINLDMLVFTLTEEDMLVIKIYSIELYRYLMLADEDLDKYVREVRKFGNNTIHVP